MRLRAVLVCLVPLVSSSLGAVPRAARGDFPLLVASLDTPDYAIGVAAAMNHA